MRSHLVILACVGLALAANHPGWKDNTEYIYQVKGRTLTTLPGLSDQYSGIFVKATLHLLPWTDNKLQCWISNAQYVPIHSELPENWDSEVDESRLNYKPLAISQKPFNILANQGLIKGLEVEKSLSNWEANLIKSIVSQFQLDLNGNNLVDSPMNVLPSQEDFTGVFKTMEETVTGETETSYDIHRIPDYALLSQPWLVPQRDLHGNSHVYEIVKNKNYTNSQDKPLYHYGFSGVKNGKPSGNQMGEFYTRQSTSRMILSGKLSKYTIQTCETVNRITINPTEGSDQKGLAVSSLNLTLWEVRSQNSQPRELSNPIEIGNLVYTYESPFAQSNEVREKNKEEKTSWQKFKQAAKQMIRNTQDESDPEEMQQYQHNPAMSDAPSFPLLPYYSGCYGKSVRNNKNFNLKQNVRQLAQKISQEVNQPEEMLTQSTLSKYAMLTSLVRLMNEQEIRSVSQDLYTKKPQWTVFRDAVAQAGTGPAFLNIQEWIAQKKIESHEAAEVVSTMSNAIRTPTEEFIRKFFDFIQKPDVRKQESLNSTAILSFTDLVQQVYVDLHKDQSHKQFPVHTFKNFQTQQGKEFLKKTVIPYFSEQLNRAISQADTQNIHLYIRALGNIAHRNILEAFEPYLEGQKPATQFQRMLMVLSMDKMVYSHPVEARSVLYRIYQNIGEVPEVRSVAVYQLLRTNPPAEMLQKMAQNTNKDTQEQVNAVVKSGIESICTLKGREAVELRKAGEAAKPHLTKKDYSMVNSQNKLEHFIIKNMEMKQNFLQLASIDNSLPKGVKYTLRGDLRGWSQDLVNIQAMISSVKNLENVFYAQTDKFNKAQEDKYDNKPSAGVWSSERVSEALNMEIPSSEQLEGFIWAELQPLQSVWSFDNQSIEQLPQVVRELEEKLQAGKHIQYMKIRQMQEMELSFPTELGFPFSFTQDNPLLVKVDLQVKAQVTPQLSNGKRFYKPDSISAEVQGHVTISNKCETKLSLVTPFDHQIYVAGFDKNTQLHLPVDWKLEANLQKSTLKVESELQKNNQKSSWLHKSSWPYTSRSDLMALAPIPLRPHTHQMQAQNQKSFDFTLGQKETGIALRVWGYKPQNSFNIWNMVNLWKSEGAFSVWQKIMSSSEMQPTTFNVAVIPQESKCRKVVLKFDIQNQYRSQQQSEQPEEFLSLREVSAKIQDDQRQNNLMRHVSAGVMNARTKSVDAEFQFVGDETHQYNFMLAYSKSNVSPLSRLIAFYRSKSQQKAKEACFELKSKNPNANSLDFTYSSSTEPKAEYELLYQQSQKERQPAQLKAVIQLTRSEIRQNALKDLPMYNTCRKEMKEGNNQLTACQNITIESNYLDNIDARIQLKQIPPHCAESLRAMYNTLRLAHYPDVQTKSDGEEMSDNEIHLVAALEPKDLQQMNVTIWTQNEESKFQNIPLNNWVKSILVPHPMSQENTKRTCVVDKSAVQTFSKKIYPVSLGDGWTVVMQYIPEQPRNQLSVAQQLKNQVENFVVLARETKNAKEVKITFDHPATKRQTKEVVMQVRNSQSIPDVFVDGEQVHFNEERSADLCDGFVEIYALPNGEVKLVFQDWFNVIFDGERVKITSTSDNLYNSVLGLCGRFNGDETEDFWTPNNCLVKSPQAFVESYKLDGQRNNQKECIRKNLPIYSNVVTPQDLGKSNTANWSSASESGMRQRNRYTEQDGEICFTIHPVPECKTQAKRIETKRTAVHCINKTKTAYYLKNQIDQGGNPDFSHKTQTKTVDMEIPAECY